MTPPNLLQPVWNRRSITAGTKIVYVPNDWHAYDEVWAHVRVHGTTGNPTSGFLTCNWQIAHPQDSGDRTRVGLEWRNVDPDRNGHLFVGGLDWPRRVARGVEPAMWIDLVRGLKLGTGLVRLQFVATLAGGTNPAYEVSVSLFARRALGHAMPMPQGKELTAENNLYNYISAVWGYSLPNPGASPVTVEFRNGGADGPVTVREVVPAGETVVRSFPWPLAHKFGLYYAVSDTGILGVPVIWTTDNLDDTP